jgi:hypothetical protein
MSMRTGRFRFVEKKRWFRETIQVLEVEITTRQGMFCDTRVYKWINASASDAWMITQGMKGRVE